MKTFLLCVSCLFAITQAQADIRFTWDYPRTEALATVSFLLTATEANGRIETYKIAPMAASACASIADATEDTWCTTVPCPGNGVYLWTIRAVQGDKQSALGPDQPFCVVTAGTSKDCTCTAPTMPTQGQDAPLGTPTPALATPLLPTPQAPPATPPASAPETSPSPTPPAAPPTPPRQAAPAPAPSLQQLLASVPTGAKPST